MQEIVQLYSDSLMRGDPVGFFSIYKWIKNNPDAEINDTCKIKSGNWKLLHLVCMWGPRTLLEAILQHPRCDVNILDDCHHTPTDKAMICDRGVYVRTLNKYGGKLNIPEYDYQVSECDPDINYELKHTKVMILLLATKRDTIFGTLPDELLILLDSLLILRAELHEYENTILIDMLL